MDNLQILNDSRMARIVFDSVERYVSDMKKKMLARIVSETKLGPVDPQVYARIIGGISALEDLETLLKKEILKGEKIERELLSEYARNER